MSGVQTFIEYVYPILYNGTWTNYGSRPPIVAPTSKIAGTGTPTSSKRHNKNERVEIKNGRSNGAPELTFDNAIIDHRLKGSILAVSTDPDTRGKLKQDIMDILMNSGIIYRYTDTNDVPDKRDKHKSSLFLEITDC